MASPSAHSMLSPSSAHRWLKCTAAPRFEQQFPSETSRYAEEGTLAHEICELYATERFGRLSKRTFNAALKKLQAREHYDPEMIATAEAYVRYLTEKANAFPALPVTAFEQRVDLTDWIPGGFGSCDCIMVGGDTLHITDYKHGQGVVVDAKGNPQMRLYALGALKLYRPVYGETIRKVSMGICQPRITDTASEDEMTVEELLQWGEYVRAQASKASSGEGAEFCPGEKQCRFCRGKYQCPARAAKNTALEDFKHCVTPDKAEQPTDREARAVLGMPPILSNEEIGDLLKRGAELVSWYGDLKEYALRAILGGESIPGWKAVEGRSDRAFSDQETAFKRLREGGCAEEQLYETKPRSLAAIEKTLGKKRFGEILGDLIIKPRGKPTLADENDKREPFNNAASDFNDITK